MDRDNCPVCDRTEADLCADCGVCLACHEPGINCCCGCAQTGRPCRLMELANAREVAQAREGTS